jgi:uncharacterized protein YdeI (BOF family)
MKAQATIMAFICALAFLAFTTTGLAQSAPGDDSASTPAIAYSEMQTPVPEPAGQAAPDPIPPTQQQQPEDRPAPGRPGQGERENTAGTAQPQQNAARTLTGTIIKNGDQYVLTTEGNINFQLDDQERASRYRDKQVKVTGTVDATTRKVHVQNIEPLV